MNTTTAIAEQEIVGLALLGTAAIVTLLVVGVIAYIISAIGYWKMFQKAGVPGWKAFVPFVNTYEMFKMSWEAKKFWIWLCLSAVAGILFYFADTLAGGTSVDFLPDLLVIAASVFALDYSLKMNVFLAQAYGKGRAFGSCLWVFPFIASLILGFGKARYIGNQSAK